jgi:hypothetical protein
MDGIVLLVRVRNAKEGAALLAEWAEKSELYLSGLTGEKSQSGIADIPQPDEGDGVGSERRESFERHVYRYDEVFRELAKRHSTDDGEG